MIYLHVGFPKTASSTIQRFLAANARALKQRGLIYPPLFVTREAALGMYPGSHNALAVELRRGEPGASWRRLRTFMSRRKPGQNVVLSGEALSGSRPQQLREALGDWDVTIIFYMRTYAKTFVSQYWQQTKGAGNTLDFDAFLESRLNGDQFKNPNYFADWAEIFGPQSVKVRALDDSVLTGGDVRLDILDAIGIDTTAIAPGELEMTEDVNATPGWKTLEILRDLNTGLVGQFVDSFGEEALGDAKKNRRNRTESPLLELSSMISLQAVAVGRALGFNDRGLYLTQAQFDRCNAAFDAQVDAVRALGVDTRLAYAPREGFVPRQFLPSYEHVPPAEAAEFLRRLAPLALLRMLSASQAAAKARARPAKKKRAKA